MDLEQLLDREAIRQVLFRYCRGIDRRDRAALDTVYWPDAIDDHVHVRLSGPDYVNHVLQATAAMLTAHHLTNLLIEPDAPGNARSEAYFIAMHEMIGDSGVPEFIMLSGRYLDRFAQRAGEWRILHRTLVFDMQQTRAIGRWDGWLARIARLGAAFPHDALYSMLPSSGVPDTTAQRATGP